jgi:hypothetical protein
MKTQKYKESTIINKRIGNKKLRRKFESKEIDGQKVYFDFYFNLCEIIEKFNFLDISMLRYIEVILSTELIFSDVSLLWSYFESSLKLIRDWKVELNSVFQKEVMKRNIETIYFVNTNDETDCHRFFCNFFEENKKKQKQKQKLESFVERKRYFFFISF